MDRRLFLASSLLFAASPLFAAESRPQGLLLQRFPGLSKTLARLPLTEGPSPVTEAGELGESVGLSRLYVKRDDLACRTYAGSKVRKLELLLGHARAKGCTHLVTAGSVGSHHALATAIHGSVHGFSVELLLMPEPPGTEVARVLRASAHFAAAIHYVPTARDLSRQWQRALARHPESAYSVPLGGTSPLGNLGYVEAALELERQVDEGRLPEPARIYVPLGTMGCAVGLLLGLRLTRLRSRLVAVRASNPSTSSPDKLRQLYEATGRELRALDDTFPELAIDESTFTIDGRHLGGGYAIETAEGTRAMHLARERAGLVLERTYTAKTLAALVADAPKLRGQSILFWNTHAGDPPECSLAPERLPKELLGYVAGRAK
ncbi:MAG: pyridoxal-phosphate dependent enzyme [Polyangiaceae bacterium]|nr:pyridoxal-phosphate dependent enzyme [Polyangiaceae bacterium]